MSIRSEITSLISQLLPTKTRVVVRGHQQPPASSHVVDVDVLHGYLRSAEAGDCTQLFGLYRDIVASHSHTQAEFSKRKLAVLGDPLSLVPADPEDPTQASLAGGVQAHLMDRPGWIGFLSHCLDSTLYPVALTERSYKISGQAGWRYELGDLRPVPHIHLAWPYGVFSIKDTNEDGYFLGTFSEPNPRLHIVHRGHLLSSVPDYWGGPMRSIIFWWLFATMDRDWWARFLDRFGSPFLEGKYDETDDRARYELADAFSAATRLFGLVVSKDTEIKMHQANTQSGGEAFEKFHTTANEEISKVIIGQTTSAGAKNLGLNGGGQAAAQSEVREDIRRYDALALGHLIKTQILAPLWRLNGWTTPLPNVAFGAVSEEEADLTGDLVASLFQAGLEPTDEGLQTLSKKLGLALRRVTTQPHTRPVALSALPTVSSVARRAARQRQARRAVDSLVADASPKLARLMTQRAEEIADAIDASDSPESAAAAIATLAASYDPGTASDLVLRVLTSAAVNSFLAMD